MIMITYTGVCMMYISKNEINTVNGERFAGLNFRGFHPM